MSTDKIEERDGNIIIIRDFDKKRELMTDRFCKRLVESEAYKGVSENEQTKSY